VKPTRETFLAAALACEGVPYIWAGKTPRGLDCSGLVTWALRACGGPDLRALHGSDRLFLELPEVVEPQPGDLAFYGAKGDPSHVVICLGGLHDQILGANGEGEPPSPWRSPTRRARR
jgi:cell wall-associated NlpC family hydrolase